MNFVEQIQKARRIGAPIVVIQTSDQIATAAKLATIVMIDEQEAPVIQWDLISGMRPIGDIDTTDGEMIVARTVAWLNGLDNDIYDKSGKTDDDATRNLPAMFLNVVKEFAPEDTAVFMHSAGECINNIGLALVQAILNLRDPFKSSSRTLFLLGPDVTISPLLAPHVIVIDEPLPSGDELAEIAMGVWDDANKAVVADGGDSIPEPDRGELTEALTGLAAFPAENAAAMSLSKAGYDMDQMWGEKTRTINDTRGLRVYGGDETFDDLGGLDRIKEYLGMLINGKTKYSLVVFIDEIEKALAGAKGDTSGVSQGLLQQELTYMEDRQVRGLLFIGHSGTGKSATAKAIGATAGIPCVEYDLNGMKDSLVGQTEGHQRAAHKTFDAVAGGSILYVATCNGIDNLPPELRSRFNRGTFFFDLPTPEEREVIWKIHLEKLEVENGHANVNDDGWTGREIKQCCEVAYDFDVDIETAARYVIPISRSANKEIESLCEAADGKFQAASSDHADEFGAYRYAVSAKTTQRKGRRVKVAG